MSAFLIIVVGLLLVLGVINLVVGVSNDAINFLNSALGSRVAPYWVIMAVASIGVVMGATFSNGMMEVAQKGILLPQYFSFNSLLLIFLGAILTNVLVLDGFNTYGFPTSTTVTFVFSMLGGTLAAALMAKSGNGMIASRVIEYFNAKESKTIVSELFWSVPTAFLSALIIQFLSRILFGFDYQKHFKLWGPLWCTISIGFIIYYLVFQGFGGASFATESSVIWINKHARSIVPFMMIIIFGLLYYLYNYKQVNILKFQILAGTFALAMAFAGNNLVNFIGISLSSLRGYIFFAESPSLDTSVESAGFLFETERTPTVYLLTAGLFIVLTIWLSRKAKTVAQTELQLTRQSLGYERFSTSAISKYIVKYSIEGGTMVFQFLPAKLRSFIESRYQSSPSNLGHLSRPSFDPIRASVNLTVSTVIISLATMRTLPISTTYITFMAAMGSSLADGAWGKENAGNRISGVIYIFVGWLATSVFAFVSGFLFTMIMLKLGTIGILLLAVITVSVFIFFNYQHKKLEKKRENDEIALELNSMLSEKRVGEQATAILNETANQAKDVFQGMITAFAFGDKYQLKKVKKESNQIRKNYEVLRDNIENVFQHANHDLNGAANIYVQTILGIGELSNIIRNITLPSLEYTEHIHPSLNPAQLNELQTIFADVSNFINLLVSNRKLDKLSIICERIETQINENKQAQLNLIKTEGQNVKSGILYLKLLSMLQNFTEKAYEIAAMQAGITVR